jgi:dihydrofolate reductase
MRKIIATAQVSLDGVMQGQGSAQEDTSDGFDLGGWSMKFSDAKAGAAIMGLVGTLDKPYDLLLGRKTYDIFASYWPYVPADNPIGPVFTKANKYVLTRGSAKFDWANSHKMRGMDDVRKAKAREGPDIVLWGSSTLSAAVGGESDRPVSTAHLSDSSWKGQKALRQHLAPREHETDHERHIFDRCHHRDLRARRVTRSLPRSLE